MNHVKQKTRTPWDSNPCHAICMSPKQSDTLGSVLMKLSYKSSIPIAGFNVVQCGVLFLKKEYGKKTSVVSYILFGVF